MRPVCTSNEQRSIVTAIKFERSLSGRFCQKHSAMDGCPIDGVAHWGWINVQGERRPRTEAYPMWATLPPGPGSGRRAGFHSAGLRFPPQGQESPLPGAADPGATVRTPVCLVDFPGILGHPRSHGNLAVTTPRSWSPCYTEGLVMNTD
jgi:hypothetical protein